MSSTFFLFLFFLSSLLDVKWPFQPGRFYSLIILAFVSKNYENTAAGRLLDFFFDEVHFLHSCLGPKDLITLHVFIRTLLFSENNFQNWHPMHWQTPQTDLDAEQQECLRLIQFMGEKHVADRCMSRRKERFGKTEDPCGTPCHVLMPCPD